VGAKSELLDKRLTVDFSLYHIAWKNIQIQLRTPQLGLIYTGNGGDAKSQGVELSVAAKPFNRTTLSGWVDYDDAALTSGFGNSPNPWCAREIGLPLPRAFASISLRQDFPLVKSVVRIRGDRRELYGRSYRHLRPTATRQDYPGFTADELQAGLTTTPGRQTVRQQCH